MKKSRQYIPHLLLAGYVILWAVCAINPYSRDVWIAENVPIMAIALLLTILFVKGVRFSNLAYVLASVLLYWHTIGGHYTFERVPFGMVTDFFGWDRNNFDRVGHFSVGFYAFLFLEYFVRSKIVIKKWVAYLAAFSIIGMVAAVYEVIEMVYAIKEGGAAGAAFLGSQGDVWDAQKDMLMDMLGAVAALLIFALRELCYRKKTD